MFGVDFSPTGWGEEMVGLLQYKNDFTDQTVSLRSEQADDKGRADPEPYSSVFCLLGRNLPIFVMLSYSSSKESPTTKEAVNYRSDYDLNLPRASAFL